jgi:MFS family permease
MGLNEFAGYLAVSLLALLTGFLAATYGLRPVPFYPGIAFATLGLLLSILFVRETKPFARLEAQLHPTSSDPNRQGTSNKLSFAQIFLTTSWKDRALFASSQAGMVNNLNDGMVWGLVPIFLAGAGLPLEEIGLIAAVYPGVWGISQILTGALTDRLGRKWMIASGMWIQALGIGLFVVGRNFLPWLCGSALLGIGTALVYPTLLAAVSDVAHPEWRASAVGVYRLWRDGGYAVGALLAGILTDVGDAAGIAGIPFAMLIIAALTFISGIVVATIMYETLPARRASVPVGVPAQWESSSLKTRNNP